MPERELYFCNRSDAPVHLIIEPVADTYELDPGQGVTLRFDEPEDAPIEVEYHGTGDIGIWTHALTKAYKDDVLVSPT